MFLSVSIDGNRDRLLIWVHNIHFILKDCFLFFPPLQCHRCCILLDLWFSLCKKSKLEHCKSPLSSPLAALKPVHHLMPNSFSYQSELFPGALGNRRWEQGRRREGYSLARSLLTWAYTLFLKFVFSAGGTVAAPAPSVQQRAVSFEIWRKILKKWLGQEGRGA